MNKYISIEVRHVAALILVKARSGIRPPAMRNVRTEYFIVPRMIGKIPSGRYYRVLEVVEE